MIFNIFNMFGIFVLKIAIVWICLELFSGWVWNTCWVSERRIERAMLRAARRARRPPSWFVGVVVGATCDVGDRARHRRHGRGFGFGPRLGRAFGRRQRSRLGRDTELPAAQRAGVDAAAGRGPVGIRERSSWIRGGVRVWTCVRTSRPELFAASSLRAA